MNIKNRLTIIESKLDTSVSSYCCCYGENLKYEVIPITLDEWKRRFDTGEERHERLPDFCESCRKLVDKRFIETTYEQMQETQQRRINEVIDRMSKYSDN